MDPVRARLAAQRLSPSVRAGSALEAARAVCGVQAQDVRSSALALRSRVAGLTRAEVREAGLVRTWTVRGTLHLIAPEDRAWLHALCAPRFLPRMERALEQRGQAEVARGMLDDLLELVAERPRERAELLERLAERGHPELGGGAVNVLMPWVALQGLVVGTSDGLWARSDPPPAVDEDEALATLARRYLEGHGPAGDRDLAAWSGLPLGRARRALELAGPVAPAEPAEPPECALLPAFDPAMLGWASRDWVVPAGHDRDVLPGGGMLRAVVLAGERVVGTWRGSGAETTWFGPEPPAGALAAEVADVGRFLAS
ncbi:MAG TPA: winged helix DNA-binding domain-containing protein [Thermoleophilaceae bacterium]|nr:winged helix DNA-binding domain-containing protein [Thermoleophilaceae bacterium]